MINGERGGGCLKNIVKMALLCSLAKKEHCYNLNKHIQKIQIELLWFGNRFRFLSNIVNPWMLEVFNKKLYLNK